MIALAFATILAAVEPNPVVVTVGEHRVVTADFRPSSFVHGAGFTAEDPSVAEVTGSILPRQSVGDVSVTGLKPGQTRIIVSYPVGFSLWRMPVATLIVNRCTRPAITTDTKTARLLPGDSIVLSALAAGSTPLLIEWVEENRIIGTATPLTLRDLEPGTRRIVARVSNACGAAVTEEIVLEIAAPRRRASRH